MTEPMKQRWEDVGQRFEALGRVLKERYQSAERAPDTAHAAEQDEASEERVCAFARRSTRSSWPPKSWVSAPLRSSVTRLSRSRPRSWRDPLNEALTASVDQIGDEVGRLLKRTKGAASSGPHDEQEPPAAGSADS